LSVGLLLFLAAAQAAAEQPGEIVIPRIVPKRQCATAPDDEIVVCGRMDETERYRMRGTGRSRASERGGTSWGARVAEQGERERYGSQTVGPSGYLQGGLQRTREWRAERDEREAAKRQEARMIEDAVKSGDPD
jgi:hypothetical protein